MLRIVRRGDRHDPRDLTVSLRFEGDFGAAFREGHAEGLVPSEPLKNLVHGAARQHASGDIETFGLALSREILAALPRITRVRIEIAEQPWTRVEAGGKAQGQAFLAAGPEQRTATITSGQQTAVVSGIDQLVVMRTSGFTPPRSDDDLSDRLQPLVVGSLSARWTYSTGDVTFGPPIDPLHALRHRRRGAGIAPGDHRHHVDDARAAVPADGHVPRERREARRAVRRRRGIVRCRGSDGGTRRRRAGPPRLEHLIAPIARAQQAGQSIDRRVRRVCTTRPSPDAIRSARYQASNLNRERLTGGKHRHN
jgi:hypothetical protein